VVTDCEAAVARVVGDFVGTTVGPLPTAAKHRLDHGNLRTSEAVVMVMAVVVFVAAVVGALAQGVEHMVPVEAAVAVPDIECDIE
jgi:hypothetical protein